MGRIAVSGLALFGAAAVAILLDSLLGLGLGFVLLGIAIGGVLGLFLGVLFLPALKAWTGWTAVVPAWAILLAIGISCVVGVLAGLVPAFRGSKLNPIEALRYE